MHRPAEFAEVIRFGKRARRETLTVYLRPAVGRLSIAGSPVPEGCQDSVGCEDSRDQAHPHVGLVVSKAVGNSVVRHRVSRQLRAQLALRVEKLPRGVAVVVRANPSAARSDSQRLGHDLDAALTRILRNNAKDRNAT